MYTGKYSLIINELCLVCSMQPLSIFWCCLNDAHVRSKYTQALRDLARYVWRCILLPPQKFEAFEEEIIRTRFIRSGLRHMENHYTILTSESNNTANDTTVQRNS